ncbi:hypothetical protein [Sphingomonas faeni]|uniref:hypothetical protein n=1 Tax=Sphingomonas faeni TaxID=185950 RepID=UPI002780A9F3|nr:hypothetical protein [Sphingomonas faeni]MDQ0836971.1 hypothetical protein [Sphingomonas faeni]
MTEREAWLKAGEILAEHGDPTVEYTIAHLGYLLDDDAGIQDWRRDAAAVDAITGDPDTTLH